MARRKKKGAGACKKTTGTKQPAAIDDTTRDQTKAADRQPQTIPATTFRPFSKLPIELRLITWECALSKESANVLSCKTPTAVDLCRESREAAQKFYNLRLDVHDRLSIRTQCPNVWLCQLLFLSVFYEEPDLLNGFASLSPEEVHEGISPYLATCDYPPVRYTGGGEFEPDTDCEDDPGSSSESDDSIADSDAEVVGLEDGVDAEEAADLNEETQ
ncbi:hypothetical protein SCUP515_08859 [Seiridium cupressi]